ncbi:hypothetical protein [Egicoccus sp. AB-alg6-2]|uniref:hypothetical protein n=1 Tax=Egicoccus sp. AB-alg6-2 TaxID=3242692 RepID=UPI00359E21A5
MASDQTTARILHDVGAAAWFGGSLMGAVGLHGASGALSSSEDRVRVADVGWKAWQPWKLAAILAHVVGSIALLWGNKGRLTTQRGAMAVNVAKTGVFAAALGADVYAAVLGRRIGDDQPVPVDSAVEPAAETPEGPAATQRQLQVVQWVVPVLTGLNIALASKMGEQQRPTNLVSGLVERFDPRR